MSDLIELLREIAGEIASARHLDSHDELNGDSAYSYAVGDVARALEKVADRLERQSRKPSAEQ